ncbi:hypothetical protein BH24DEI2_BH24DEI2_28980 [soil metagenome]
MLSAVILGEPLSFFLFEMMTFGLFFVCLVHGLRHRTLPRASVGLELFVFVLYGLAFESIAVVAGFYSYGPFLFRVWHAPLVIGVGWAVIGYAVMRFSDSLNMPQWAKPFLDALLALLVDLGMDVVAIRDIYPFRDGASGMWNWGVPFHADWFGVPYANFMAWWLVVFIMSACLRGGRYVYSWVGRSWLAWVYPVVALLVALGVFLFLLLTFTEAFTLTTLLLLIGLSLVVTITSLRGRQRKLAWRTDWPVFLVPTAFHLYFLGLLLARKLYVGSPGVLAVSVVAFFVNEAVLFAATRLPFKEGSSLPQNF